MRDQCLFFTQETNNMVQEDTRSAGPWIYRRPAVLILRGQSATPGKEYLSLSFSICSFLTWKPVFSRLFAKQPQQLELNCFRICTCSSTNQFCPLIVEPLLLLGNFSNIRQRLLRLKTWGAAPPLEWGVRYIPVAQLQLVLPSRRGTNTEKRQNKEVDWGELEGGTALWYQKCHPTSPKGFNYGLD